MAIIKEELNWGVISKILHDVFTDGVHNENLFDDQAKAIVKYYSRELPPPAVEKEQHGKYGGTICSKCLKNICVCGAVEKVGLPLPEDYKDISWLAMMVGKLEARIIVLEGYINNRETFCCCQGLTNSGGRCSVCGKRRN